MCTHIQGGVGRGGGGGGGGRGEGGSGGEKEEEEEVYIFTYIKNFPNVGFIKASIFYSILFNMMLIFCSSTISIATFCSTGVPPPGSATSQAVLASAQCF